MTFHTHTQKLLHTLYPINVIKSNVISHSKGSHYDSISYSIGVNTAISKLHRTDLFASTSAFCPSPKSLLLLLLLERKENVHGYRQTGLKAGMQIASRKDTITKDNIGILVNLISMEGEVGREGVGYGNS